MKEAFKEFFSDISPRNSKIIATNHLVWINVMGIPFKLWSLDFMKEIGNVCSEFITISKQTLNRRRLDLASILISTPLNNIPTNLPSMLMVRLLSYRWLKLQ